MLTLLCLAGILSLIVRLTITAILSDSCRAVLCICDRRAISLDNAQRPFLGDWRQGMPRDYRR
jgi:hypothetical protein